MWVICLRILAKLMENLWILMKILQILPTSEFWVSRDGMWSILPRKNRRICIPWAHRISFYQTKCSKKVCACHRRVMLFNEFSMIFMVFQCFWGQNLTKILGFRIQILVNLLEIVQLWRVVALRCRRVRSQTKYLGLSESRAAFISGVYLEF